MNRILALNFAQYFGLHADVDWDEPEPAPAPELDSNLKSVLDEIFAVDPVTGNPKGDIQYFLSKDGNPQVKAWLESNLLVPRRLNAGYDTSKYSDDLIAEFTREDGESVSDYSARLASIRDEAMKNYKELTKKPE